MRRKATTGSIRMNCDSCVMEMGSTSCSRGEIECDTEHGPRIDAVLRPDGTDDVRQNAIRVSTGAPTDRFRRPERDCWWSICGPDYVRPFPGPHPDPDRGSCIAETGYKTKRFWASRAQWQVKPDQGQCYGLATTQCRLLGCRLALPCSTELSPWLRMVAQIAIPMTLAGSSKCVGQSPM